MEFSFDLYQLQSYRERETHVVLPRQSFETLSVVEQEGRLLGHLLLVLRRLLLPARSLRRRQLMLSTDLLKDASLRRDHSVGLVPTSWRSGRLVDGPEVQVLVD